jgi:hypothetical protein
MNARPIRYVLATAATVVCSTACAQVNEANPEWQEEFDLSRCTLKTEGRNPYFVLEPGFQLVLEGGDTKLYITALDDTKTVDGVATRIVEEREWKNGNLYEVSKNYFAICQQTKDVFYFGEDVDYYENGIVVKHDGSWLAGVGGNRPGLMMAGTPKVNMRYYQELAPGIAMDRAEFVSLTETCKTPAGTFNNCLKIKEGSSLNPDETEYKYYAPGIGLIQDENLLLTAYGFAKKQ